MPTLHIEHAITDMATWRSAFEKLADVRRRAGVRNEQLRQPVGDPTFVLIDLEFDTTADAEAFLRFLESQVWAVRDNSPAFAGNLATRILEPVR